MNILSKVVSDNSNCTKLQLSKYETEKKFSRNIVLVQLFINLLYLKHSLFD